MDHPGGDGPNTYIVAKATRNAGITMALSGIGGDELFAGYGVFKRMATLQKRIWLNALPQGLRMLSGLIVRAGKSSIAKSKIAELLAQEKIDIRSAYLLSRSIY